MNKVSVVLIVRNEEKNIEACIDSASWAGEVIVIDQSSSDRTAELARARGAKVCVTEAKNICNPDRERGIAMSANEWIFLLEADERITPELRDEALAALSGPADIWYVPVKTFFLGKWIRTCGWYPAFIPRFFRKGTIKFETGIHTNGSMLSDKKAYFKNALLHYSYTSLDEWIRKFTRYTTQIAGEEYARGKRPGPANFFLSVLARPVYFFLVKYVLYRGFLDGWRGFFISLSSSATVAMAYFKLVELHEKDKAPVRG